MRLRRVARIARWEVSRSVGRLDRRTAAVLLAVAVLAGGLAPAVLAAGGTPDQGIYRVAVSEDSPYRGAVAADARLRPVAPADRIVLRGGAELRVHDGRVHADVSEKGQAALATFRSAVAAYNDRLMAAEDDRAAAFPVSVRLRYDSQDSATVVSPGGSTDGGTGDPGGSAGTGGAGDATTGGDGDGRLDDGNTGGDGSAGTSGGSGGEEPDGGSGRVALPDGSALLGAGQSGTPSELAAPFPLRALLLAFAFVLPLNVVVQAYGSSVMGERLNRRGELLLVSPATPTEIVAGKTAPYLAGVVGVTAAIAAAVGAGPASVVAVLPIACLFLAATFLGALLARSFKELTFVTVTVSVSVTSYAFVPAVFTEIHPIAAISPLSVVVQDVSGSGVDLATLAFSTLPVTLVAAVCFGLGVGIYREEDLFTQRPIPAKALDALAAHLTRRRVAVWSALAVPLAFVAELFAVAALFVLPIGVSLPLLLTAVAVIEEVAKSAHVFAGYERSRFGRDRRTALLAGGLSGVGFAAGEKLSLLVQLVGIPDLELGRAAFAPAAASDPLLLVGLLLVPFALHAVTATISSLGARRSARGYAVGLGVAVVVHLAYNLAVVSTLV